MARTGRTKAELTLSDDERATLQRWARRAKSSQALALRANIILTCAQGHDNKETAALLRCHQATVGKWRKRFTGMRLDGLADEPRPTGPGHPWRNAPACPGPPSAGSGRLSTLSPTWPIRSSCPPNRCS